MPTLDLEDIQGIIVRGYGDLEAACYILLGIHEGNAAREWLASLAAQITNGAERPTRRALNMAITCDGLQALGLNAETLVTFPYEFRDGMTSEYRQRILGDHGDSAPVRWDWGGPNTASVHILLMLFAVDESERRAFCESLSRGFSSGGVQQIGDVITAVVLRDAVLGCSKEHFGFCDALAQPFIAGLGRTGPPSNTIQPGEFILGYPNEYHLLTESPIVRAELESSDALLPCPDGRNGRDLGRNGTYLVFRQLQQHVNRFWQFIEDATRSNDGKSNPDARIKLAAKMVGRWPSGASLVLAPEREDPTVRTENNFGYFATDPRGLKCPIGSHVRRSNPRDSLDPSPGSHQSIAVNKRHQLLRRGRAYGRPVVASMDPEEILRTSSDENRGLCFICVNANISRQFEFVQQTWINNPKFAGLYNDTDPLVGDRSTSLMDRASIFTEQAEPVRRVVPDLPEFVTVRGGAYFFLPSLRAIRYLAMMTELTA
jgi:Dyp-type peroxidase family